MVAIHTYSIPAEDSSDKGGGGKETGGERGGAEENYTLVNDVLFNQLYEGDNVTDIPIEEVSVLDSGESTTEVWCPRRGASPEYLRQLQVITLVVIGLIGLIIVSCLLLCMFYKNERLLEKMPWRKKRLRLMQESGREMTSVVNTSLPAVPSLWVNARTLSYNYSNKSKGKHFPTHKTMLVDVDCRLTAGDAYQIPLGICPGSRKASLSKASRLPRLSSGAPDPNNRPRCSVNDAMMRRHHNMAYPGQGLPDVSWSSPDELEDLGEEQSSEESLWSESSERKDQDYYYEEEEEDEQDGYVAESRLGARGERGKSLRSKDHYTEQYGSSMAKSGQTPEEQASLPHEVSYLSGRFW